MANGRNQIGFAEMLIQQGADENVRMEIGAAYCAEKTAEECARSDGMVSI